jgi:hypothetical protein
MPYHCIDYSSLYVESLKVRFVPDISKDLHFIMYFFEKTQNSSLDTL